MVSHSITNSSRATVPPERGWRQEYCSTPQAVEGQNSSGVEQECLAVPYFLSPSRRCSQFCVRLHLLLPPATSVPKSRATLVNGRCKPCTLRTLCIFRTRPNRFPNIVAVTVAHHLTSKEVRSLRYAWPCTVNRLVKFRINASSMRFAK